MNLRDPGLLLLPAWISVASIEWVPNFRDFFFSSMMTSNFIKSVVVSHIKWLNLSMNNEKLTNLGDLSLLLLATWTFCCGLYILARRCICLLLSSLCFLYCRHPWFVVVSTFSLPVPVSVPVLGSSALPFASAVSVAVPGLSAYFLIFYCSCNLFRKTWSIVDRKADEFRMFDVAVDLAIICFRCLSLCLCLCLSRQLFRLRLLCLRLCLGCPLIF